MIGFIEGKIKVIGEDFVVLQTSGGVGYLISTTYNLISNAKLEDGASFFVETIVKEDSISLFGFASYKELLWFRSLIKVSGVGAKIALLILSSFKINDIISSIERADKDFFCSVSGIGEKLALRIINEMKKEPKKNSVLLLGISSIHNSGDDAEETSEQSADSSIVRDASLALESFGFSKNLCYSTSMKIFNENNQISLQDLIKKALKILREN